MHRISKKIVSALTFRKCRLKHEKIRISHISVGLRITIILEFYTKVRNQITVEICTFFLKTIYLLFYEHVSNVINPIHRIVFHVLFYKHIILDIS